MTIDNNNNINISLKRHESVGPANLILRCMNATERTLIGRSKSAGKPPLPLEQCDAPIQKVQRTSLHGRAISAASSSNEKDQLCLEGQTLSVSEWYSLTNVSDEYKLVTLIEKHT